MQAPQDPGVLDALRRGAPAEALAAAQATVAARPDDATALRLLAIAQQAGGDAAAALASIERAIALAPEDAEAHLVHARLLLGTRQPAAAAAALKTSTGLDPNQFPGYILQALLALARNDLAEAERQRKLAALLDADHPYVVAIDGMVALQRGDAELATRHLSAAVQALPADPMLRNALGFALLAQGHLAFAEQAFRGVLDSGVPEAAALRPVLAELLRRQNRIDDAIAELQPLLDDPRHATPPLRRFAGELLLVANRPQQALPLLQAAFAAQPQDTRALRGLVHAWRAVGDDASARAALDGALATMPQQSDLWRARLAFEPFASPAARELVRRWREALPDDVGALEASVTLADQAGDSAAADAALRRILELDPTHARARARRIDALIETDPPAAIAELDGLLARATAPEARRQLRGWLGFAHDRAHQPEQALQHWLALHAEAAPQRAALPAPSAARGDWPALATPAADASATGLLWGAPGSAVEQVALGLAALQLPVTTDRFGPQPPQDGFSAPGTGAELAAGSRDAAALAADWRAGLSARGIAGQVIDWLPHWDNALLLALRPHVPEALLLVAVRDPRDMLLDWLAFGAPVALGFADAGTAARWLAGVLNQVAALHEQDLFPHRLLRLDDALNAPQALADLAGAAIETPLPALPAAALGPRRFAPGHWRAYASVLAEPFAQLAGVARRLGYET